MAGHFDDLVPGARPGGVVIGTHPADRSKQLQETRTQQEIDLARSTADARAREAKAQADKAEIDAKNAQDQYDAQHPHADAHNSGLTGQDFLKTLSPSDQSMVLALSVGRLNFPSGSALKAPFWQEKLSQVAQFDKTFDATNYNARAKARADLSPGGSQGSRVTSLGTALTHAGELQDAISALGNHTGFIGRNIMNPIGNAALLAEGDSRVTNFQDIVDKYSKEGAKILIRTGSGTADDRNEAKNLIALNNSPEQQMGVLQTDAKLYMEAIRQLDFSIKQQLGPNAKVQDFLSPEALDAYRKLMGGAFSGAIREHGDPLALGATGPGGGNNPGGPPRLGGGGPPGSLGPGGAGGPSWPNLPNPEQRTVAQGQSRNIPDPEASAWLEQAIRSPNLSPDDINQQLRERNSNPIPNEDIVAVRNYLKDHPGYHGFANALRSVPLTTTQQVASSPASAMAMGGINAATAGYGDELAAGVGSMFGADYGKLRDRLDADKKALAELHPEADLAGNVAGGAASLIGGQALAGRLAPGAVGAASQLLGKAAPLVTDAAYGGLYGSGENNQDRGLGALLGGGAGMVGGSLARGMTRGLAAVIAPDGGALRPLYDQGTFPSLGQRAAAATGPVSHYLGKGVNAAEQALQSIPLAGSLVYRARQIPRDAWQLGGFNDALSHIGQQLPDGMAPGTGPHAFTQNAFTGAYDKARSGMQFAPDPAYLADETAFNQALGDGTLDATQAQQVRQRINTAVGTRLGSTPAKRAAGQLSGDAYKAAASALDKTARDWSTSDPLKANALRDYLTIFDNAARRNSHPDAVAALDNADTGYAKFVRIEDASRAGGSKKTPGTYTAATLMDAAKKDAGGVRSKPFLRGDALMQDYATAGQSLDDTLPNSGSADRLFMGQAAAGGGGIIGGGLGLPLAALAKPGAALLSPYLPGINKLVTRAMAPRSATLPPQMAAILDAARPKIEDRAPMIGRLAVPGLAPYLTSLGLGGQ